MLESSELKLVWYIEELAMKSAETGLLPKAHKVFPL